MWVMILECSCRLFEDAVLEHVVRGGGINYLQGKEVYEEGFIIDGPMSMFTGRHSFMGRRFTLRKAF